MRPGQTVDEYRDFRLCVSDVTDPTQYTGGQAFGYDWGLTIASKWNLGEDADEWASTVFARSSRCEFSDEQIAEARAAFRRLIDSKVSN